MDKIYKEAVIERNLVGQLMQKYSVLENEFRCEIRRKLQGMH